jgi:molybdopterin synthase sulfur carrier subunit
MSEQERDVDSIKVKVHTILDIKKIIGKGEIEIPVLKGSSVRELVAGLVGTWGEALRSYLLESDNPVTIHPHLRLMVNGRDIAFLGGMDTVLEDGDEILILPPVSGG